MRRIYMYIFSQFNWDEKFGRNYTISSNYLSVGVIETCHLNPLIPIP